MAEPPSKTQREKCWSARDRYFECLDQKDNDKSKCLQFRNIFEENCTKTWVSSGQ